MFLYWKFETDILENRKTRQKHFDWPFTFFLSCFRTNFDWTFQSHFYNFSKPFCPWSTFVCWVLNTKLANCKLQFYFTQYLQIFLVIANISSMIIPERRYIYFFSILQDVQTALEHSIAGCWCSRFLFSLFAGFIFSSCWSFCLSFLRCCQPRLFDFCHRRCSSSPKNLRGITHSISHPFFAPKP